MITFKCDYCGAGLRVADSKAGSAGKCPGCQRAITIPAVSRPEVADRLPANAVAISEVPEEGSGHADQASRQSHATFYAYAGLAVCLLAAGVTIAVMISNATRESNTKAAPPKSLAANSKPTAVAADTPATVSPPPATSSKPKVVAADMPAAISPPSVERFCPHCWAKVPANAKICDHCGANISATVMNQEPDTASTPTSAKTAPATATEIQIPAELVAQVDGAIKDVLGKLNAAPDYGFARKPPMTKEELAQSDPDPIALAEASPYGHRREKLAKLVNEAEAKGRGAAKLPADKKEALKAMLGELGGSITELQDTRRFNNLVLGLSGVRSPLPPRLSDETQANLLKIVADGGGDNDWWVREEAVTHLKPESAPLETWLGCLRLPDGRIRLEVIRILEKLADQRAAGAIAEAMKCKPVDLNDVPFYISNGLEKERMRIIATLRVAGIKALAALKPASAAKDIMAWLQPDPALDSDSCSIVPGAAIDALAQLKALDATPAIVLAAADSQWRVRRAAANAMTLLANRKFLPVMEALLSKDSSEDVRRVAIEGLVGIGGQAAIAPLKAAGQRDPNDEVKDKANKAVAAVGCVAAAGSGSSPLREKPLHLRQLMKLLQEYRESYTDTINIAKGLTQKGEKRIELLNAVNRIESLCQEMQQLVRDHPNVHPMAISAVENLSKGTAYLKRFFERKISLLLQGETDEDAACLLSGRMAVTYVEKAAALFEQIQSDSDLKPSSNQPVSTVGGDTAGGTASLPRPTISLHQAAGTGNLEEVKSNLHWGADVNAPDDVLRMTALHEATSRGYKEVVALLLAKGADAMARDKLKCTPLHYAANKEVALLLLAKKVDVNAVATGGMTALHMATSKEVMAVLLENGADINAKTWDGATPLRWAEREGKAEIAEFLRSRGATK